MSTVSATSFFFQAEDGIRAFHVTGVQTCALPIFLVGDVEQRAHAVRGGQCGKRALHVHPHVAGGDRQEVRVRRGERSEERRVGTEGRARWSRSETNKRTQKRGGGTRGTRRRGYKR